MPLKSRKITVAAATCILKCGMYSTTEPDTLVPKHDLVLVWKTQIESGMQLESKAY